MARPRKQPNYDFSLENLNRQYQVAVLLPKNVRFQKDAEQVRKKYGFPERTQELVGSEKKEFIEDVKKIVAKVAPPGDYAGIVTSLILGDKPEYNGWMYEPPKQSRSKQLRVKPLLLKNLMMQYYVNEKKMKQKQVADYMNGIRTIIDKRGDAQQEYFSLVDYKTVNNMNYSDISKHLEKLEKQIDEIYS